MERKEYNIEEIVNYFNHGGEYISSKRFGSGHINDTFLVTLKVNKNIEKYILQRVNTYVFKKPVEVMQNISLITRHIKQKLVHENNEFSCLTVLHTIDDKPYYIDDKNNFWRMQSFQDNVVTFSSSDDTNVIYNAAKGFGYFTYLLSDFDATKLNYTIPDFQNVPLKYEELLTSINNDKCDRAKNVKNEIAFFKKFESEFDILENDKELPLRVTHNDTKLNNILLHPNTYKPASVIDLDTVMPGLIATDFSDAIRSISASEDERDLKKIVFNKKSFEAYTKGYLESTNEILTKHELEVLPEACKLISLSLGMRFLSDYLNGNVYFNCSYEEENLHRALTQMKLTEEFDKNIDKMGNIIKKYI